MPACFRYVVGPVESRTTNVFRPAAATPGEDGTVSWRHQTIGGAFVGHMDKITQNKRVSIVWEAGRFSPCCPVVCISFFAIIFLQRGTGGSAALSRKAFGCETESFTDMRSDRASPDLVQPVRCVVF